MISALMLIVIGVGLVGNTVVGGLPDRVVHFAASHGALQPHKAKAAGQTTAPTQTATAPGAVPTAGALGARPVFPVLGPKS